MKQNYTRFIQIGMAVIFLSIFFSSLTWTFQKFNSPLALSILAGTTLVLIISFLNLTNTFIKTKESHFLILIILLSSLPKFLWVLIIQNEQVSDFAIYHELALALIQGKGYVFTGPVGLEDLNIHIHNLNPVLPHTTAYRVPGVPFWAAFLYSIFGSYTLVFKLSNVVMSTAVALFIYFQLKKIGDPFVARLASFLWAIYPPAIFACSLIGTEILYVFLITLASFLITKFGPGFDRWWSLIVIGLILSFSVLVRSTLSILIVALCLTFLLGSHNKNKYKNFFIVVFFICLGISPWTIRNMNVFGSFIPVTTSEGIVIAERTERLVPEGTVNHEYQEWRKITDEVKKSKAGYDMAMHHIRLALQGGPLYIVKSLANGFYVLFRTDVALFNWGLKRSHYYVKNPGPRYAMNKWWRSVFYFPITAFYFLILIGVLIGIVRDRKIFWKADGGVFFLGCIFLLSLLPHLLLTGTSRYHFMWMPFFIILSAYGWRHVKDFNFWR